MRNMKKKKTKYLQQKYIVMRAEKEGYISKENKYQRQLTEKQKTIASYQEEMKFLEKERKQLEHELETLEREYRSSNLVQREKS